MSSVCTAGPVSDFFRFLARVISFERKIGKQRRMATGRQPLLMLLMSTLVPFSVSPTPRRIPEGPGCSPLAPTHRYSTRRVVVHRPYLFRPLSTVSLPRPGVPAVFGVGPHPLPKIRQKLATSHWLSPLLMLLMATFYTSTCQLCPLGGFPLVRKHGEVTMSSARVE